MGDDKLSYEDLIAYRSITGVTRSSEPMTRAKKSHTCSVDTIAKGRVQPLRVPCNARLSSD